MERSERVRRSQRRARYKARFVARGFQQEGLEFIDTFAPVAHLVTIHTIVALAATNGGSIKQSDVKTVYLNAELDKPIHLEPPAGLCVPQGKLWKLRRTVYGLGSAGRLWWQLFAQKNKDFGRDFGEGMQVVTDDECSYVVRR
eukprot:2980702-Rhodomonas_salina.1